MLSYLWNQLVRSGGVFVRTIRAFFIRRMTGIISRVRRVTNFSRNAARLATASVQSAVSAAQKPTKREDYVETSRLLISKALLLKIFLALIAAGLILYFLVWPFVLSNFLTARFVVGDSRISNWTGRVVVYADAEKTLPLYAGHLENGVLQGRGEEYDENGLLAYEGWFQDGMRSGNGTAYEDGVMVYSGQFVSGAYEGTGTAYADGMMVYEGQFVAGVYEGRGKLYEDGVLQYEGSFQDGAASGDGTAYYASGVTSYSGQFSGGLPEGTGTAYDEDGQVLYIGEFAAGAYNGSGTLYLAEDGTIEGEFADGDPQGVVQWKRDGRLYYEGEWSGAQISGFGTLYSRSGAALYEGQLSGGTLDGNWLLSLTAEKLRTALGEDNTRNVSDSDGFLIVSDALGLAALCSYQTETEESQVYAIYLFQPEEEWIRLLPGMERVSLPTWPEDTEIWSGQMSFEPRAGIALEAGAYRGQVFTTSESRTTILYASQEESVSCLLGWSRLEGMPDDGLNGTSDGGSAGGDGRLEAFLERLDLMEATGSGTQATQNPYYGTAAVTSALSACGTLEQANGLIEAMLDYWEQSERQSALEENLTRTQTLLEEARAAQSMGQGSADTVAALEAEEAALQAEIQTCTTQRKKAEVQAQAAAGVTPSGYALGELLVSFDPTQQDVSQLAQVAVAYAQSAGQVVDTDAVTLQVKTELIDLAEADANVQAALSAYQSAASSARTAAGEFAMGRGSKTAWYETLSAQADARAELCGALAVFTSRANTLNQTTGGWVSRTFAWYDDILGPLFQSAAEEAAGSASAGETPFAA